MICYFAQFLPDPSYKGAYHVAFPDLPGCFTYGADMREALAQAADAMAGYLEVEIDMGEELPKESSLEDARAKAEAQGRELQIAMPGEAIYQMVCAEPKVAAPEQLNIWIGRGLFLRIRELAKEKGVSVSHLLGIAAREYMKKEASGSKKARC